MTQTQKNTPGTAFTGDYLDKRVMRSLIQTERQLLLGSLHIRKNLREKDELNHAETFIAVTDVEFPGTKMPRIPFLMLNKEQIIWVAPYNEPEEKTSNHPGTTEANK
jgi:hypothetical protein